MILVPLAALVLCARHGEVDGLNIRLTVEHINVAKLKLVGLTVLQIVAAHTEGEHLRCGVLEVESRCDEQRLLGSLFAVRNLRVVRSDLSHLFAGRGIVVSERIAPLGACLIITQVLLI